MVSDFPPSAPFTYDDILVEYLEVCIPKEQEQLDSKDLLDVSFKSEGSASDSDSGRGSCDSHTLLTDKCRETKEEKREKDQRRVEMGARRQQDWDEEALARSRESMVSPVVCNGRVKTWPSVFSTSPEDGADSLEQQRALVMARQRYPSDNLYPPGSAPSYVSHPSHGALRPEFTTSKKEPRGPHRQTQSRSDVDVSSIGVERAPAGLTSAASGNAVNADAQSAIGEKDASRGGEGCQQTGKYYSKVKGVDRSNMLLLQREETKDYSREQLETDGGKGGCYTYSTVSVTKNPASATREEIVLTTSGYVDTTMCMLPSH